MTDQAGDTKHVNRRRKTDQTPDAQADPDLPRSHVVKRAFYSCYGLFVSRIPVQRTHLPLLYLQESSK